ncbi:hypothetical protein FOMA001_g18622 [Fusarium oxysporum f. sp. matthiolae]|nr:hypothetical protein FOMA001_g18622 [Fusarium oxysporum f. sp. matthiolae]
MSKLCTRSVSTLTPSQLARKRANDREAQRAIRARTKEHIDRLERELEELKSEQSRDQTVQELLRRNQALEEELMRLRENMGVSITSSPYSVPGTALSVSISTSSSPHNSIMTSPPVYDANLRTGRGGIPSPRGSPFPSGDDCNTGYISTGVRTSLPPSNSISDGHAQKDVIKMEYEDVVSHGTATQQHPAVSQPLSG